MLVRSIDGTEFAIGAVTYNDTPETVTSSRIILQVKIGGFLTDAFVDTDSQYVVCTPEVAEAIGLNPADAIFEADTRIGRIPVSGRVHLVEIQFDADQGKGESLSLQAFAFVVDDDALLFVDELPSSSIGFTGCLESVCFAIDGGRRLFYFG